LKTVLFTDIVGSTQRAAEIGDHRWRALLDAHDAMVRREIARAQAIGAQARGLGLEVRAGLHTGDCEIRGDDFAGIAVHIGARVAALAEPGEILTTATVRDLVAGAGIEFAERGVQDLKGVPGEWRILAVRGC
jgi:class 3 adenylate cyclase